MAGETLVGVESGAEAVIGASGDDFDFAEAAGAVLEKGGFVGGEPRERGAGAGRAGADSGIDGAFGLREEGWAGGEGEGCDDGKCFGGPLRWIFMILPPLKQVAGPSATASGSSARKACGHAHLRGSIGGRGVDLQAK